MTRTVRRGVIWASLALALAFTACRKREQDQAAPAPQPTAAAPAAAAPEAARKRVHPPLPEDPELAAKSAAQWDEHLREEEEHRQLCYDRDRLAQHRAVVTQLTSLRERYDRARSEADVAGARAHAQKMAAGVQKQLDAIDPWKNSSVTLPELQATLKLLVEAYPGARLEVLRGGDSKGGGVAAELDRRAEAIRALLERAERCKDE